MRYRRSTARIIDCIGLQTTTMEPPFNEVQRDRGNLLVKSRVRYIEHLHLTNFWENYQNVRYIEVQLIINLQNPLFPDLKNYCNNTSVPSYAQLRHQKLKNRQTKLLKTVVHINFILVGLFGIYLLSHGDIYSLYRGKFYVWACGFCSL